MGLGQEGCSIFGGADDVLGGHAELGMVLQEAEEDLSSVTVAQALATDMDIIFFVIVVGSDGQKRWRMHMLGN